MNADYTNKFVVQTESGHRGSVSYTLIGTRDGMSELLRGLSEALAADPASIRREWEPAGAPLTLVSAFATIARGQRADVTLTFQLVDDLGPYHVTRRARLGCFKAAVFLAILVAVLYFLYVGVYTSIVGLTGAR